MHPHAASLERLRAIGTRLRDRVGVLRSLSPGRREATPLVELGERLLTDAVPPELGEAFGRALEALVEAQSQNFPRSLFWDFDYPAARLLAAAACDFQASSKRLADASTLLVTLQRAYGEASEIKFRYAHDFTYGFDWARWVLRESASRENVGPFDIEFLLHLQRRAREIGKLIAGNDERYPRLPQGVDRNPFGFTRGPLEEERLHRDLAERGLIPVEAWRVDAVPRWREPFSEFRAERARALGLSAGQ
jgi:hypothetical protein